MQTPDVGASPAVLIKGALLYPGGASATRPASADILIQDGRIQAIKDQLIPPANATVLPAKNMLAMPGLINAHFHSSGNLMRGMLDGLPLEIFMLREVPPLLGSQDSQRLIEIRTLLGAAEMLRNGITSVMDDAYHVPCATQDGIDAICNAYQRIGMRARVAIDQPNVIEFTKYPYLEQILPEPIRQQMQALPIQSEEELCGLYEHLIGRCASDPHSLVTPAVSCSAPHRVTETYLQRLNEFSLRYSIPFNMHILETKVQRVFGQTQLGQSLVKYAQRQGILHPHSVVIHAIWVDDEDIQIMAKHNVMIAHNPICNLRLGSGIAPFRKWRDAGCRVCLGTDEILADDRVSMFDVMKTAAMVHTLSDPDWKRWPSAQEILAVALQGGAQALGQDGQIGVLKEGALADLILLDREDYAFTPLNDLSRQLVFSATGQSVRHVFVNGRHIVNDRVITTINESALRDEARVMAAQSMASSDHSYQLLEPYYREMVLKAHQAYKPS